MSCQSSVGLYLLWPAVVCVWELQFLRSSDISGHFNESQVTHQMLLGAYKTTIPVFCCHSLAHDIFWVLLDELIQYN